MSSPPTTSPSASRKHAAPALSPSPSPSSLRVLCLGDSLTAGYSYYGSVYHPYNEKLEEMLRMAFPHLSIETVEDGVPGDRVMLKNGRFYRRMEERFEDEEEEYDWTIVLGGTNDLAIPQNKPEDIFDSLKKIWSIPLAHGSKVLALTVPEAGIGGPAARKAVDERRDELNRLIRAHKQKNFCVYDLHAAVPYFSLPEKKREEYWDDGVHFTPDGYDWIGTKVGMALVSLLEKAKIYSPPAKKRRAFKDDQIRFDEEDGDPDLIDQGYIVVRHKDLE